MSTKKTPYNSISIYTLQLDKKNPRLPIKTDGKEYTQNEILAELIKHDKIYELAKSISEDGFLPIEVLIAYKDKDGKSYVLEGNRRLAACRLLDNPTLAPTSEQSKFKKIAKNFDTSTIKKLWVHMVKERVDAYKMIVKKHTDPLIEPWKPLMKSNFYARIFNEGASIAEVSEMLGVTEGDIKSAIFLIKTYEAATKLDYEPEVEKVVKDPYKFELTTFDRVVGKQKTKDFLGIETNDEGDIKIKIESTEFKKGLKRIVTDIATGKEDSRSLNKVEDIEKYLNGFDSNSKPDISKKVQPVSISDIFEDNEEEEPEPIPQKRPQPKAASSNAPKVGLIPKDVKCEWDGKVYDIYDELKRLPLKNYPNSAAMALRMLLELATYEYLKESGELKKLKDKILASHNNPPKNFVPELRQMLDYIIKESIIDDVQITKALRLFINDSSHKPILNSLNQFVHNVNWSASEEKIRLIWKDLDGYFKITLQKPKVSADA